jgi:chromosomal replication initiation ATPase DnaA
MSAIEFTEDQIRRAHELSAPPILIPSLGAQQIACQVARQHGIDVERMLSPRRSAIYVRARTDLYRALRRLGWSYPKIGRFAGGRDHTTIMWALGALDDSRAKRLARVAA